jgi:hypothetical protein
MQLDDYLNGRTGYINNVWVSTKHVTLSTRAMEGLRLQKRENNEAFKLETLQKDI